MRHLALALLLVVVSLLVPMPALAQGPGGDPRPAPLPTLPLPPLPPLAAGAVRLELYRVAIEIKDQIATTRVEQVFVNEGPTPAEGVYLLPLPEQAAISEFNMLVDGHKVAGQLLRKEEARAIYESIVRQQRDPALLEHVGRDLFQARVFPIPPGGRRAIELSYSQVLPTADGLTHYRYGLRTNPLLGDQSGARFQQPIGQLAISVSIATTQPLRAVYSPSHPVVVTRPDEHRATVGYEQSNVTPAADFDLYFSAAGDDIGVSLLTYKPADEDGYFLLLATPKISVDQSQVVARDVLLVLDTSGSMSGVKIEQARQALLYVLDRLNPQDRFNVISFSTGVRQFAREPAPVSQLAAGRRFVAELAAGGGTDINRALLEALAQVDTARPTVIVFLTDGLPTEGEVIPERIMANVSQNTASNVQIFAFGVGDDVNTVLLDTISQEQRGVSAYVRPEQAIDEIVSAFYAKIATPVLAKIELDFGDVFVEEIYPYPLPDLFAGSQLVVTGRYRGGGATALRLSGLVNDEARTITFDDLTFRAAGGEPFIARLWATRKIGYLLNQMRLRGQNPELVDAIVQLATRFGIATPYTSFYVPEPAVAGQAPPTDLGRSDVRPLPTAAPQPAAVVEVRKFVESAVERAAADIAQAPASGAQAVAESQAREALRSAEQAAAGDAAQGLRYAADKTFAYQAGMWVDTRYRTDLPRRELVFGSADYFQVLSDHPAWATYFAVSPHLIVVLDGMAYIVTDSGQSEAAPAPTPGEAAPSAAGQPPATAQTPPAPAAPLCAAPALGIGLLAAPRLVARRRPR